MIRSRFRLACSSLLLATLAACGGSEAASRDLGIKEVPLAGGASEPTTAVAELGKHLFFDPRLSANGEMSCSTCHQPDQAWTDGKKTSEKHDGSMNKWNSPTMYNVGYLDKLYWDGRSDGVLNTVNAAWKGQMGGEPEAVASKLAAVEGYQPMFQAAFQSGPTAENIAEAIAGFLRSLKSGDSPFDRFQVAKEQGAISTEAKLGWELFMGKAGCNACHTPPLFTDRGFHNTGRGMDVEDPDPAAGKLLGDAKFGAYKTPTLRNVAKTAPYFHDGSVASLEEAVRWMAGGGFDNPHRDPQLMDRELSDDEIKHLVAFLESLSTDEPITAPQLPQ